MRLIIPTFLLLATCLRTAVAAPLTIITEHSPPASMRGPDGVITGRATDKIREMMTRTGTEYTLDLLPWKRAFLMAQTHGQTCLYSTSRTPDRETMFKWVGPTDEAEWQFWGRADHSFPLNTLDDARKLRIGTYLGDARDEYLRSRGFNVEAVSNDLVNPQKLLLNRIDLWAVAIRNGASYPGHPDWSDKVVPLMVFHRVKVYLACNPSVPDEQIDKLNAALAEMRRDGTLTRIDRKYDQAAK
ncbi:transporter substrate-binding domain-containing protein [Duganella sp. FT135W]|uniref:Transporter substrate-binding domain-containing protein n=1 Tax=Duganella flavida TaxID=2692175 RepID=A0A6L8KIN8_9BURK|nr:transporter substrate-binding domain-containing protein [Duganella flavida]MYM25612.1 transporter substrate-binding domain-containing protein [Duganella flavida]